MPSEKVREKDTKVTTNQRKIKERSHSKWASQTFLRKSPSAGGNVIHVRSPLGSQLSTCHVSNVYSFLCPIPLLAMYAMENVGQILKGA